jgi:hypothetical protein
MGTLTTEVSNKHSYVALIFEFDDILAPDSTSTLLKQCGLDVGAFWQEKVKPLVDAGYDPTLAYLNCLLEAIREQKALGSLTVQHLRDFGAELDKTLYPGLPHLFRDLAAIAASYKRVKLEFYIVSSGLQDFIAGSKIVSDHFTAVYGSLLGPDYGVLRNIKRCINFTEKTRYLFEISKSEDPAKKSADARPVNPLFVNRYVPFQMRRIPFKNMIFVGNAFVDVPCFSVIKAGGGLTFGVTNHKAKMSARQVFESSLSPERPMSVHVPGYEEQNSLRALLRAAVATRCSQIQLEHEEVLEA